MSWEVYASDAIVDYKGYTNYIFCPRCSTYKRLCNLNMCPECGLTLEDSGWFEWDGKRFNTELKEDKS